MMIPAKSATAWQQQKEPVGGNWGECGSANGKRGLMHGGAISNAPLRSMFWLFIIILSMVVVVIIRVIGFVACGFLPFLVRGLAN